MRLLFTFAGGVGHFLPLLPLAHALAAEGHDVAFGAQAAMLPTVKQAGFEAFDTGGRTIRDVELREPLLELDMEREYRVVREGYAGRVARQRARQAAVDELRAKLDPLRKRLFDARSKRDHPFLNKIALTAFAGELP